MDNSLKKDSTHATSTSKCANKIQENTPISEESPNLIKEIGLEK